MRRTLPPERDLSTEDLLSQVLQNLRSEAEPLGALVALHDRPTRQVVERIVALCSNTDPYERSVGLRILRELRHPDADEDLLWEPLERMVIDMALTDDDPVVAKWAISCLGYRTASAAALAAVLGKADALDARVRFAVAAAVPHMTDDALPDPQVVEALLLLAEDLDANVRSYAIMALVGDLHQTQSIARVLQAHLADSDPQIRRYCQEALDSTHD